VSDGWRAGLQDAAPALQVALGMVLLLSGIGKARDRHSLVAGALRYRVLAPGVVRPAAALLPFVEVSLGAALVLGVSHRPTAWLAAALFAVFAVAVGINLRRGRAMPRHWFSASAADRIGPSSLARLHIVVLSGRREDEGAFRTGRVGDPRGWAAASRPGVTCSWSLSSRSGPSSCSRSPWWPDWLIALEDTIDGLGQSQGSRTWVATGKADSRV